MERATNAAIMPMNAAAERVSASFEFLSATLPMVFCTFFITKMMRMSGRMQPIVMTKAIVAKILGSVTGLERVRPKVSSAASAATLS